MTDRELMTTLRGSIAEIRKEPNATPATVAAFLWHCIANAFDGRPVPEVLQLVRCTRRAYNEIYGTTHRKGQRRS